MILGSGEKVDWGGLAWTSLGTFACAAAANTLNQVYEVANDSLMERTKRRPLPLGLLSRRHALVFAGVMGVGGVSILAFKVRWACTLQLHPNILRAVLCMTCLVLSLLIVTARLKS